MGGTFGASVNAFVQHGRVSSKYFAELHSWLSHLQADLAAACRRDINLGTGGGQQPCQICMLLSLAMFLESFRGSFGTSSSTCEVTD